MSKALTYDQASVLCRVEEMPIQELEYEVYEGEIQDQNPPISDIPKPHMVKVYERAPPKIYPRNNPCPCGSGIKHKKCCLQKGEGWGIKSK